MSDFQGFKDKPDMSQIWLKHVDRTNLASGNIMLFEPYVRQQLRLLPSTIQKWVRDQEDLYMVPVKRLKYRFSSTGRKLGREDDPVVWNVNRTRKSKSSTPGFTVKRLLDGSIDWTDPNIHSPVMVEEMDFDYEEFNNLIMVAAENAGLSWKVEPINSEYGLYPEVDEDMGTRTPLDDPKKNEDQEHERSRKICWINYKDQPKRVTNFRGYACGIEPGEKPWFFTDIAHRQKKQEPIVILVTATQGKGKTYTALRLAEIFDNRFNVEKQVAMDRNQITKLVSGRGKLKRNQCIVIDESQFGANARSWGNKDQQALMNFLAAARFYGYIIFIVALHRSMLDSIIRERIINYHIHMEKRGFATIYQPRHQRFDETNYPSRKGKLLVQLPDFDACDYATCLDCPEKPTCNTLRARYERVKTEFVQTEAAKQDAIEQAAAIKETTDSDLKKMLMAHKDKIPVDTDVATQEDVIREIFKDEYNMLHLSNRQVERIRKLVVPRRKKQ